MRKRKTYRAIGTRALFLLILCMGTTLGISQSSFDIKIGQTELFKDLAITSPSKATDTLDLIVQLRKTVKQLHDKGYLAAFITGIDRKDSLYLVNLNPGEQYSWMVINP